MVDKGRLRRWSCDVMDSDCPARTMLGVLADKWTLLVLEALAEEPRRTGELRRRIGGVSEKMLQQTLRRLQRHGLVSRKDLGTVPPHVVHSLTELGWSLSPIVAALDRWIEDNAPEMLPPP